jgi:hypothetical protein
LKLSIIDLQNMRPMSLFFLLEIKKLYNVCAIDDIIIKQLETAEITVNVNPNICPCIYQLNAKSHVTCIFNKLLWSRTKLFDN